MIEPAQLLVFMLAGWLLNLTPGPDVLYIVSQSLRSGRRAGAIAVAGISVGCLVHVAVAALGLGALLATSAALFNVVKWAGALYLLWVGLRLLRSPSPPAAVEAPVREAAAGSLRQVFAGGFLTNVLNPKVALFFLAFVPQFIAPSAHDKTLAFAFLGVVFIVNSLPVNFGYVLLAGWTRRSRVVARGMHWLDRMAGVLFIGFSARLALAARPGA
ncbi:LysE family translocator [Pseudoxanthomonas sangjuensis]|uniref:LysE family translocator n=1 Tax=Pseudoxanthomonas sangjuensis TaxID=1503750 RepID=UPI0013909836|nr:LysE family translocator [Pseudoxanthomonas sangjuensis]KAF1713926.1 lysine transporter LysE [Pseudoxanthomonas sangjuensis]